MDKQSKNSGTRYDLTQLQLAFFLTAVAATAAPNNPELAKGFTVSPDPSILHFQGVLSDTTGNYSLGFLRVEKTQLQLAVVHVPSSEPFWVASTTRLARWSEPTRLFFNGSLVLSDPHSRVYWSTGTDGDRVSLSNTSNLQIWKLGSSDSVVVLWESYNFPSDTLVENQNFTSAMTLVSSNGEYSMRLGWDFIGLYAKFNQYSESEQIYLKHKALEAKADIVEGGGPISAVLSSDGFLGMYQNGSVPVDVQSFSTFQQSGSGSRRIRLEPDGNLKGYYWTGSTWALDYQAISDPCELPSSCGPYGLCQPGQGCSCLDNKTDYNNGKCSPPERNSGEFCRLGETEHRVLRRVGVELPFKEQMGYEKMGSLDQCETACEGNCKCWGAVYSNSSGFCYMVDYPIQTLVAVGDETKMGYLKVRVGSGRKGMKSGYRVGIGLLCGAVLVMAVIVVFGLYSRVRRSKRTVGEEDGGGVGPYKDLGAASFRSIELCER